MPIAIGVQLCAQCLMVPLLILYFSQLEMNGSSKSSFVDR